MPYKNKEKQQEYMKQLMQKRREGITVIPIVVPVPPTQVIMKRVSIVDKAEHYYFLKHNKYLQILLPHLLETADQFNWYYLNDMVLEEFHILYTDYKSHQEYKLQHKKKYFSVLREVYEAWL